MRREQFYTRNFIPSVNYLWEADTVVMTSYAKENENYRYFLLVVNAGVTYSFFPLLISPPGKMSIY
jgi:hypothetical protein